MPNLTVEFLIVAMLGLGGTNAATNDVFPHANSCRLMQELANYLAYEFMYNMVRQDDGTYEYHGTWRPGNYTLESWIESQSVHYVIQNYDDDERFLDWIIYQNDEYIPLVMSVLMVPNQSVSAKTVEIFRRMRTATCPCASGEYYFVYNRPNRDMLPRCTPCTDGVVLNSFTCGDVPDGYYYQDYTLIPCPGIPNDQSVHSNPRAVSVTECWIDTTPVFQDVRGTYSCAAPDGKCHHSGTGT